MKYLLGAFAVLTLLLTIGWRIDRTRLLQEVASLERRFAEQERNQDAAELKLFKELTVGQAVDASPGIRLLADDTIRPGHDAFDFCSAFLAEHFPDSSEQFGDCEIVVFDVSVDAVPFQGGSYWIVIRDNRILLAFPYMTIIGG